MADVGRDTRGTRDIIKGEGGDLRIKLHKEGEGLADAAGGSQDSNFAFGSRLGGVRSAKEVGRCS